MIARPCADNLLQMAIDLARAGQIMSLTEVLTVTPHKLSFNNTTIKAEIKVPLKNNLVLKNSEIIGSI